MKKNVDQSPVSTEATDGQIHDLSENIGLTPENLILLNSGMEIIKQIPDNSPLIGLLRVILFSPIMKQWGNQVYAISSAKEHLVAKGCFEDASILVVFFCNLIKFSNSESQKKKDKAKTKSANKARNSWYKNRNFIEPLWDYLVEVECKLHPPQDLQRKRSVVNEKIAVTSVFKANKTKIMTILCEDYDKKRMSGVEMRAEQLKAQKKFEAIFKVFTEKTIEYLGTTVSGHTPEERAPRTDASKKNSSSGAKASIAKRKAKLKKQSPST